MTASEAAGGSDGADQQHKQQQRASGGVGGSALQALVRRVVHGGRAHRAGSTAQESEETKLVNRGMPHQEQQRQGQGQPLQQQQQQRSLTAEAVPAPVLTPSLVETAAAAPAKNGVEAAAAPAGGAGGSAVSPAAAAAQRPGAVLAVVGRPAEPSRSTTAAGKWPVGVGQQRSGTWLVRIKLQLDSRGCPNTSAAAQDVPVGRLAGLGDCAVARDLALMWRQLCLSQPLGEAREKYNYELKRLQQHRAVLTQLRACGTIHDLRSLLQRLWQSGKLRNMAASLVPAAADPAAAAAAAAGTAAAAPAAAAATGAQQRSRKRQRAEPAVSVGAAAAAAAAGRSVKAEGVGGAGDGAVCEGERRRLCQIKQEPQEQSQVDEEEVQRQRRRLQDSSGHGGRAAEGRRLRVWLVLDDGERRPHKGRVEEYTPTGLHHVLYDDGEEGLVDLGKAQYEFLTASGLVASAEAAAAAEGTAHAVEAAAERPQAEAAADVGQRLHVWWPQEGARGRRRRGQGAWYGCRVTHVLRNSMYCVRYDCDGSELLLDTLDPQQRLQWAWLERQRLHERQLRARRAQQRAAAAEAASVRRQELEQRLMQKSEEMQQQQQRRQQRPTLVHEEQQHQREQQQDKQQRLPSGLGAKACAQVFAGPLAAAAAVAGTAAAETQAGVQVTAAGPGLCAAKAAAVPAPAEAASAAEPAARTPAPAPAVAAAAPPGAAVPVAAVPAAAAAVAAGEEEDLLEVLCRAAEQADAEGPEAGLTIELACSFVSLMDTLPPQEQSGKDKRLRMLLRMQQYRGAAALMRTACELALARASGAS